MKFKLVERWIDKEALRSHFEDHKDEFIPPFYDIDDYEKSATNLAKHWPGAGMALDHDANYVGYITTNNRFVMYNKASMSLVVFELPHFGRIIDEEPEVVSYYPLGSYKTFIDKVTGASGEIAFKQELPHNQARLDAAKAHAEKENKERAERSAKEKRKAKYEKRFKNKK